MEAPPSACHLASFHPLCATRAGRRAVLELGLPPFVEGSCRRDPDLEHRWPAIAALNRGANFAPHLAVGDRVAFVTGRGRWLGQAVPHWRLVALLRVVERFEDHEEAARWYARKRQPPPSNLVLGRNPPLRAEATDGRWPGADGAPDDRGAAAVARAWAAECRARARRHGVVLACEALFRELAQPPSIRERDWSSWIGRVPVTRNPPRIDESAWRRLCARAGVGEAART